VGPPPAEPLQGAIQPAVLQELSKLLLIQVRSSYIRIPIQCPPEPLQGAIQPAVLQKLSKLLLIQVRSSYISSVVRPI
jgi:hypothetical protein